MTTKTKLALAAGALGAAFGSGAFLGRATKRPAVQVVTVTRETKTDTKTADATEAKATTVDVGPTETRRQTRKVVSKPDGTKVVTTETQTTDAKGTKTTVSDTKVERVVETKTQVVYQEKRVTVPAPLPRWSLGGFYGRSLDGKGAYGVQAGVRALGPIWVDVIADVPHRAVMGGVSIRW